MSATPVEPSSGEQPKSELKAEIEEIRATAMDLLRQLHELEVKYLDTINKRDGRY